MVTAGPPDPAAEPGTTDLLFGVFREVAGPSRCLV